MPDRPLPPLPDPAAVERLRWPATWSLPIALDLPAGPTRISLRDLEPQDLLAAVRALRTAVPAERQSGWPRFCRRVALPLVRCELVSRPLRSFEAVQEEVASRRTVLWFTPICLAYGMLAWRLDGDAVHWVEAVYAAGILIGLRWWANRSVRPRVVAKPLTHLRWATLYLAAAATLLLMMPVAEWLESRHDWPEWQAVAFCAIPPLICCGAVMCFWCKSTQAFEIERDADAVEEWDALHAAPQREPAWLIELRNERTTSDRTR